jgi:hypothetical protein
MPQVPWTVSPGYYARVDGSIVYIPGHRFFENTAAIAVGNSSTECLADREQIEVEESNSVIEVSCKGD